MIELEATVLCCTPTYALRLAEVAEEEEIDLSHSSVRRIVVAGEPGGSIPATREKIEQAWSPAKVFDHHGMTEVGPVTFECPRKPGVLHVIETAYYAEILDPNTFQPVFAGHPGELVLTTLGRTASPLIRYRTGDLVCESRQPCPCGRVELTLDGGILGRVDDMVVVRGVNIYPSAIEEIVRRQSTLREYRVLLKRKGSMPDIEVEIEGEEGPARQLERDLELAFSMRINVRAVAPGTLPRFEMKARRWIEA